MLIRSTAQAETLVRSLHPIVRQPKPIALVDGSRRLGALEGRYDSSSNTLIFRMTAEIVKSLREAERIRKSNLLIIKVELLGELPCNTTPEFKSVMVTMMASRTRPSVGLVNPVDDTFVEVEVDISSGGVVIQLPAKIKNAVLAELRPRS